MSNSANDENKSDNNSAAGDALILNPSFEDGLNNWTVSGDISLSDDGVDGSCVSLRSQLSTISQSVDWTNIDKISFWYKATDFGFLSVYIGNTHILDKDLTEMDWTSFEYNVGSINGVSDLKFENAFSQGLILIDNITYVSNSANDENKSDNNSTPVVTSVSVVSSEVGVVVISVNDINGTPVSGVNVIYTINNGEAITESSDGNGQVIVSGLSGEVTVYASFSGNANYSSSNNTGIFNFTTSSETNTTNNTSGNTTGDNSTPVVTSVSVVSSEVGVVVISVNDINGTPVSGVNVIYTINNGEAITESSDGNGQVIVSGLSGEVTVYASFSGNANYSSSNNTGIFNFTTSSETNTTNNTSGNTTGDNSTPVVTKVDTKISATVVKMVYNTGKAMTITLKDNNGKPIANAKITIILNGKTITKNTDKNGQAKLTISLVPKTYTAKVSYTGDETYKGSSTTAKIVVTKATPKLSVAKKKTFKVKTKTKKVTATLKDNKGKVLKNTKVTLKVKGKTYTVKTNKKGVATFKVTKLTKKGTFKATVKFAGNNKFKAISKTVKIIVKK